MKKSLSYVLVMMLSYSVLFLPDIVNDSYAQNTTGLQTPQQAIPLTPGVKILSPASNQQVSLQNNNNNETLQLTGTSTDNTTIDCQVSVIANDIRPYQNTTATGPGGENDYSAWTYFLAPPLIKEGSNKVTARISCIDPSTEGGNATDATILVKHSSVFFTVQSSPTAATIDNSFAINTSNTTKAVTTTSTSTRTSAVPYFVSNPNCQVDKSSHDLNCTIKIAGIENIDRIRPFLHADLTTSCINPAGNTPPGKVHTTSLIGDGKTIRAVVDVNCAPPMTPSFTYKNVKMQVGDVLLSIPGTFSYK